MNGIVLGLLLLAIICTAASAQTCRFRNNTSTTTRCAPFSTTPEFKTKLKMQMAELRGTLNSLLQDAKSQPLYRTWFQNITSLGRLIIPPNSDHYADYPVIGQAAPTMERCFHPHFLNLTLDELQRKMDGRPHQFSSLLAKTVSQLSELTESLKKVTLSDILVTAGAYCQSNAEPCIDPNFMTTSASGQQITADQDRLRKIVNFSTSLRSYIIDLLWNRYWR